MRNLAPKWGVDLYTGKYSIQYLTVCVGIDPRTMHFFDECSVVKTSGNRHYGNSPVGQLALEVQDMQATPPLLLIFYITCMKLDILIFYQIRVMGLTF